MTTPAQNLTKIARGVRLAESGAGRARRIASGVSQEALAQAIGVTAAAVSLWEHGQRVPQAEHAVRYYDAINALERVARS